MVVPVTSGRKKVTLTAKRDAYAPQLSPTGWRLLFWISLAAALAALLAPAQALLDAKIWMASWLPFSAQIDALDTTQNADKWVHLGIFAVLCSLGLRAWRQPAQLRQLSVGLLFIAVITECLQHYVPGRSPSLADLLADLAGLALGMLMVRAVASQGQ